jgi:hypothetical protein
VQIKTKYLCHVANVYSVQVYIYIYEKGNMYVVACECVCDKSAYNLMSLETVGGSTLIAVVCCMLYNYVFMIVFSTYSKHVISLYFSASYLCNNFIAAVFSTFYLINILHA